MRGSVRRRGKGWEWRVRSPFGKEVSKCGYRTRTEAEEALARQIIAMADLTFVKRDDKFLVRNYLVDVWLPAIEASVKPTTYSAYAVHVNRHLVPGIGDIPVQKLTAAYCMAFYARLEKSGNCRGKTVDNEGKPLPPKGLSGQSIQHVHSTLRRALNDAVEWGYVSRNVASGRRVTRPKVHRPHMHVWDSSQLHAFLRAEEGQRLFPLWRLLSMTGVRRGEALGLRWAQLDLKVNVVSITQSRTNMGVSTPKSAGSRRSIDLDPQTVAVLKAWRQRQVQERLKWGEHWHDEGLVFTREDGRGYDPDTVTRSFKRRVVAYNARVKEEAKKLGITPELLPEIRVHDLRHTHATQLLANGENPKVVSERLGHASVAFTLSLYAHVLPGRQREAAARFAALVDG